MLVFSLNISGLYMEHFPPIPSIALPKFIVRSNTSFQVSANISDSINREGNLERGCPQCVAPGE
jgi:hypothetical protein